jgi:ketosteroid isomerase-like protein
MMNSAGAPAVAVVAGIVELHRRDVEATLSNDPAQLTTLWTADAVRFLPGQPPDVGLAAIRKADEGWRETAPECRVVEYVPHVTTLTVAGDWAFETGQFSSRLINPPEGVPPSSVGRFVRVLQKQPDGVWLFAFVRVE